MAIFPLRYEVMKGDGKMKRSGQQNNGENIYRTEHEGEYKSDNQVNLPQKDPQKFTEISQSQKKQAVALVIREPDTKVPVQVKKRIHRLIQQKLKATIKLMLQIVHLLLLQHHRLLLPLLEGLLQVLLIGLLGHLLDILVGIRLRLRGKGRVVDSLKVLGMFLVCPVRISLLLYFMVLHEGPQNSNFLIHLTLKIKLVRFRQSQLTIVIIETLLGDAYDLGSFLKVDFLLFVVGFGTGLMQIPPLLYKFQYLANSPFFAPFFLLVATVELEHRRIAVFPRGQFLPSAITYQNKLRIKQAPSNPSIPILDLPYIDEFIITMRVNGDPMMLRMTVFGKDVVEVDIVCIEGQLLLKNVGLMCVLTLYYESFPHFRSGSKQI